MENYNFNLQKALKNIAVATIGGNYWVINLKINQELNLLEGFLTDGDEENHGTWNLNGAYLGGIYGNSQYDLYN